MLPVQYAWITAAIGSIGIFWNYIRGLFLRLSSFVVVQAEIDGVMMTSAMIVHLRENFRRTPFGPRKFCGDSVFVRPLDRWSAIGFENPSKALTFFNGLWPIFVSGISNKSGDLTGSLTISFIRGTLDIETILVQAMDKFDKDTSLVKGSKRYHVRKMFGRNGKTKMGDDSKSPSGEAATQSHITQSSVPLKWKREDLGAPTSASPFQNLHYPKHIREFITEVERWKNSHDWHKSKGLNWRMGAGLFGPPGTGKTSFVRAIAQDLDMPVHVYDLTTMSNEELTRFWSESRSTSPCIVLFEDIDRLFDKDKNIKQSEKGQPLTLDCLLNCISGVEPADGILVMVTANHPDRIDPALGIADENGNSTRPGRLDRCVYFGEMTEEGRYHVAKRILSDCPHLIEKTVREGANESGAQFESRCGRLALAEFWGKPKEYVSFEVPPKPSDPPLETA